VIVVRIELWSRESGQVTEIARMSLANDGTGTDTRCHYDGQSFKKPDFRETARTGRVIDHFRHVLPVWTLVRRMLESMGY
jgi:hypothetical protein